MHVPQPYWAAAITLILVLVSTAVIVREEIVAGRAGRVLPLNLGIAWLLMLIALLFLAITAVSK
jgi:hypothetical protein